MLVLLHTKFRSCTNETKSFQKVFESLTFQSCSLTFQFHNLPPILTQKILSTNYLNFALKYNQNIWTVFPDSSLKKSELANSKKKLLNVPF